MQKGEKKVIFGRNLPEFDLGSKILDPQSMGRTLSRPIVCEPNLVRTQARLDPDLEAKSDRTKTRGFSKENWYLRERQNSLQ